MAINLDLWTSKQQHKQEQNTCSSTQCVAALPSSIPALF